MFTYRLCTRKGTAVEFSYETYAEAYAMLEDGVLNAVSMGAYAEITIEHDGKVINTVTVNRYA